jgi:hypothetical protein
MAEMNCICLLGFYTFVMKMWSVDSTFPMSFYVKLDDDMEGMLGWVLSFSRELSLPDCLITF